MGLSKVINCILHELLIAKTYDYGFDLNSLTFCYSYLKNRKQNIKVNNALDIFQILLSGVPEGPILGFIL